MNTMAFDTGSKARFHDRIPAQGPVALCLCSTSRRIEDRQYEMMDGAFNRTGGCVTENVFARQLRHRTGQPSSAVSDAIMNRTIISFPWRSHVRIPMFQFQDNGLMTCPGTSGVVKELVDVFDDWELAHWFAQPNRWLEGAAPVDVIGPDRTAVHRAARADRYIARG